jgi:hypothetical protein
MEIPQGFESFYPKNCVILLKKTLYGTKQAAKAFWIKLLEALKGMEYTRSKADPCLYFKWTKNALMIWLSWVDDCLICGKPEGVKMAKQEMMKRFKCDEVGELKEYVGCKIDRDLDEGWIKLTQHQRHRRRREVFYAKEKKRIMCVEKSKPFTDQELESYCT